jgi:hypothetical protein
MNPNHLETFEEFLTSSFAHDVYSRELRLSQEEASYILKKYHKASLKRCLTPESSDGKCWYEMNLLPPITENDLEAENFLLKKELEELKRSLEPVK